jgi:quercetin dioxygenase-like cupin family protein
MRRMSLFLVLMFVATAAFAGDPLKVGPGIYKPQFENDRLRVMVAEFKPGEMIAMHDHPDHLAYVLSGGKLDITGSDGKVAHFDLAEGESVFLPAQSHSAKNMGMTVVKVLVIELKK